MFRISRVKVWCLFILFIFALVGVARVRAEEPSSMPKGDLTSALQDFSKMDAGQKNEIMSMTGLPNPGSFNIVNLMAGIIFGSIGFIAFAYGKKNAAWKPMVIGIVLMGYPYFFTSTLALYGIGIGGTLLLWLWRD